MRWKQEYQKKRGNGWRINSRLFELEKIMDPIGKSPIPAGILIIGKLALIFCWLFFIVKNQGVEMLFDNTITRITGIVLAAAGLVIVIFGITSLGRSISVGLSREKIKLRTGGIYSITRNPIYLGAYMMCAGSCLFAFHTFNIILFLVAAVIHHNVVLKEEEFLERTFGKQWQDYKEKVPRYI